MTRYDVLGRMFNVPDPVAVAALARSYRGIAQEAGDAQAKLTALASPQAWGGWAGQAADTFSQKIGVLPSQLGKACESYGSVAWALTDYAAQLEPVVSALTMLVNQAADAQGALDYTVAARDRALQQGQDPQASGWNARVSAAQADVSYFDSRLCDLLDQLNGLSQQCVSLIRQAQAEGIQNNAVNSVQVAGLIGQEIGIGAVHVVTNVADDLFVHPVTKLAHDLAAFDPTRPWQSFATLAADTAGLLGVLALLIPGVGEVALPFILGLSAVALVLDGVAVGTHEQGATGAKVGQDILDLGVGLASAGIGRVLGGALTQDLANGADASTSGTSLLKSGVQHFFSQDDLASADGTQRTVLQELSHPASTFLHAGADSWTGYSPAGVQVEHLQFAIDRANDAYAVDEAQQDKGGQALWQ